MNHETKKTDTQKKSEMEIDVSVAADKKVKKKLDPWKTEQKNAKKQPCSIFVVHTKIQILCVDALF